MTWFYLTADGEEFDTLGTARDHAARVGGQVTRVTLHGDRRIERVLP